MAAKQWMAAGPDSLRKLCLRSGVCCAHTLGSLGRGVLGLLCGMSPVTLSVKGHTVSVVLSMMHVLHLDSK